MKRKRGIGFGKLSKVWNVKNLRTRRTMESFKSHTSGLEASYSRRRESIFYIQFRNGKPQIQKFGNLQGFFQNKVSIEIGPGEAEKKRSVKQMSKGGG